MNSTEAPEQIWTQLYSPVSDYGITTIAAYDHDPREVHDNGKPVYVYVRADLGGIDRATVDEPQVVAGRPAHGVHFHYLFTDDCCGATSDGRHRFNQRSNGIFCDFCGDTITATVSATGGDEARAREIGNDIARIFFDGPPKLKTSEKTLAAVAYRVIKRALAQSRADAIKVVEEKRDEWQAKLDEQGTAVWAVKISAAKDILTALRGLEGRG